MIETICGPFLFYQRETREFLPNLRDARRKQNMPDDTNNNQDGEKPPEGQGQGGTQGNPPLMFDSWLKDQPDDVKGLIEDHTHGLRTALDNERNQRKSLEKQLKDAAKRFEKDSDERKALDKISADLTEANRKTDFYDAAHKVGVTNLKLAWLAVVADELLDDKGAVDFEKLKSSHPQLFAAKAPIQNVNAGSGANGQLPKQTMNQLIRNAAGRS